MNTDNERALQLATEAGHILLENGAEISRVEETMQRISSHYGVEDQSFFVLSNGIITTGQNYANAKFIPIKGTQLSRVVAVNQLSRDIANGKREVTLDELAARLRDIRASKGHPWWELALGVALGVSSFCILFGGSLADAAATFACGVLLGLFMAFVSPHMSRLLGNLAGGIVGGLLCLLSVSAGFGEHLPNMLIGTIIALVPGVPFTNGIRDLANEDYIAGMTRLLDAFLAFLCIALGVMLALILDGWLTGGLIRLDEPGVDPVASAWYIQLPAVLIGTMGFSALFGAPRRYYLSCGITGMLGWTLYLSLISPLTFHLSPSTPLHFSVAGAAFFAALLVAVVSHLLAGMRHCPATVFLICGIIPLVPGGGIFWTAYHLVANHLTLAATMGFAAIKVTIAIAGGIIIATAIGARLYRRLNRHK